MRVLLLTLTDGQTECRGLELCSISQLSQALCVPGTKLALQRVPVRKGMLLLSPSSTRVLGGRVPSLIKQHELLQAQAALGADRYWLVVAPLGGVNVATFRLVETLDWVGTRNS